MRQDKERVGHRHARLENLLLEELRALLRDHVTDPALASVRVVSVALSVDYRNARVHYGARPVQSDEVRARASLEHAIERASPFLRSHIAADLDLKRTPELRFVFDGFVAEIELPELIGGSGSLPPG